MGGIMNIKKVGKVLLIGMVVLLIFTVVYMIIPKYQIHSVRVDGDTVVVTRINTITGQVNTSYKSSGTYLDKYGKLKFTF